MSTILSGRAGELARFCIVGLTCYIVNIAAFAALCEIGGVHYVVAYVVMFFLGNALGFWLNKRFTFAMRSRLDHASMVRYVLVNCVMFGLGVAALHVLVEWLHIWYLAAATLVAAVNAPISFAAHRVVSYRLAT